MELSDQIAQYLVSGLSTGAIYALIGIGFAIIYNSTEIINFAQGELVMLGGMFALFFINFLHLPLPVAVLLAVALAGIAAGIGPDRPFAECSDERRLGGALRPHPVLLPGERRGPVP